MTFIIETTLEGEGEIGGGSESKPLFLWDLIVPEYIILTDTRHHDLRFLQNTSHGES